MPDPLIRRVLTALVALWCAFLLATWVPTYLTWPWSNDYDHFAMMAQLWDAGGKPYRDIFSFQFPGELYLFWGLGKAFGLGQHGRLLCLRRRAGRRLRRRCWSPGGVG